jgi:hypothetical protein
MDIFDIVNIFQKYWGDIFRVLTRRVSQTIVGVECVQNVDNTKNKINKS